MMNVLALIGAVTVAIVMLLGIAVLALIIVPPIYQAFHHHLNGARDQLAQVRSGGQHV